MMRVEPLTLAHFDTIDVQPAQRAHFELFTPAVRAELVKVESVAAVADGRTFCVGGVCDLGFGRGNAWSILGHGSPRHFVGVHRAVLAHLARVPFRRVEMAVAPQCSSAIRWALMLGFQFEAPMRAWFPDGSEAYLFSRVKRW
jgi:hypothetical protein